MGVTDFPFWIIGVFVVFAGITVMTIWDIVIGLFTTVAGFVVIFVYYMAAPKYPTNCQIFLERAGQKTKLITDKGGRLKNEDGTFYYRFKKLKDTTTPIAFDLLYPSDKGEIAFWYSPAAGQYFPMEINRTTQKIKYRKRVPDPAFKPNFVPDPNTPGFYIPDPSTPVPYIEQEFEREIPSAHLDIIPEDQKDWLVLKQTRQKQKYQTVGTWDRWYPLIAIAILGVTLMILISGVFNSLNPFIKTLTDATKSLAAASETNARVVYELSRRFPMNATNETGGPFGPPDVVP